MRERKIQTVDDNVIALFNARRENQKGKKLSRDEVVKYLNELKFPKNTNFLAAMCEGVNPPIMRLEKGIYMFNSSPVYKDRLQTAIDAFYKKRSEYTVKKPTVVKFTEEQAISFLKSKGYKVYRCIKRYEEI